MRKGATRRRMVFRMLSRPLLVRRGRALSALLAVVVAASVATATLNLYSDAQAKLHHEFRSYGANIVITGKDNGALPADALSRVDRALGTRGLAAPFAFAVARTSAGAPVVVAGTDFQRVSKLNRWWSVTAWPTAPATVLIGKRAYQSLSPKGEPLDLVFQGQNLHVSIAGILSTGGKEDSHVYLSLADFTRWTGLAPTTIEAAFTGSPQEVRAMVAILGAALPEAEVQPVRQIVEAEARVLDKTRATMLASTTLIVLTAALCMLATLTASVLDRRKDFAIMRALGASARTVSAMFAGEVAVIGFAGAVLGFALGLGIAAWIGRANFHTSVSPRFTVFPDVVIGSVLLALLAALAPISLLRQIQPAIILKGE
ncbi:MAG TPA: FtsX-like permease family protein [Terriglobales bacterium]|nr:FtsX-like permease family protein [Terriglobales bacterium]